MNNKQQDLFKCLDIVDGIKIRFQWLGFMIIMDDSRLVNKALYDKPGEKRQSTR